MAIRWKWRIKRFLFKRTLREAAYRKSIYATFMAKPMQHEPGSSMHIHTSLTDVKTGHNLFSSPKAGKENCVISSFLGWNATACFGGDSVYGFPYVNSYRRLMPGLDAPINTHWGYDNRTVGFRIPLDKPQSRRVENRIAGSDVNPYLLIADELGLWFVGFAREASGSQAVGVQKECLGFTAPVALDLVSGFGSYES